MRIKPITRWDLPGSYKSDYPNNDYTPLLDAANLKAVINKVNEIVGVVNEYEEIKAAIAEAEEQK